MASYVKNSLFIRNLSPNVNEKILRELFTPIDEIENISFRAFPNQNHQFFAQLDFKSSKGVIEGTKLSGTKIMGVECLIGVVDPVAAKLHEKLEEGNKLSQLGLTPGSTSIFSTDGQAEPQGVQAEYFKKQKEARQDTIFRTVHMTGFLKGVSEEVLTKFCTHFGEVIKLRIEEPADAEPFAIVEFKEKGAAHVVKTQREYLVDGRIMKFSESKTMVDDVAFTEQAVHFQAPVFDTLNMRAVLAQREQLTAKLSEVRKAAMSIFTGEDASKDDEAGKSDAAAPATEEQPEDFFGVMRRDASQEKKPSEDRDHSQEKRPKDKKKKKKKEKEKEKRDADTDGKEDDLSESKQKKKYHRDRRKQAEASRSRSGLRAKKKRKRSKHAERGSSDAAPEDEAEDSLKEAKRKKKKKKPTIAAAAEEDSEEEAEIEKKKKKPTIAAAEEEDSEEEEEDKEDKKVEQKVPIPEAPPGLSRLELLRAAKKDSEEESEEDSSSSMIDVEEHVEVVANTEYVVMGPTSSSSSGSSRSPSPARESAPKRDDAVEFVANPWAQGPDAIEMDVLKSATVELDATCQVDCDEDAGEQADISSSEESSSSSSSEDSPVRELAGDISEGEGVKEAVLSDGEDDVEIEKMELDVELHSQAKTAGLARRKKDSNGRSVLGAKVAGAARRKGTIDLGLIGELPPRRRRRAVNGNGAAGLVLD